MKRLLIPLALCVLLSSCVISKPKMLKSMSHYPHTEAVRIPAFTMKLASLLSDDDDDEYVGKVKTVEVVTFEDGEFQPEVEEEFEKLAGRKSMDLLVETRDSLESVDIYVKTNRKGDVIKEMLIKSTEPDESNIVYLKGRFSMEEVLETNPKKLTKF